MTTYHHLHKDARGRKLHQAILGALAVLALSTVAAPAVQGQVLHVSLENTNPTGGFFLTPMWFGLHDGSFDLFDVGSPSSSALEALAEDGIIVDLDAAFAGLGRRQGAVFGPAGFGSSPGQPPLIDTGETAAAKLPFVNPAAYRYFSFASMVIPSNDAFIGNEDPIAHEIFDAGGNFLGPVTIDVFGSNIWDGGTEVNNTMGAAFSTVVPNTPTDENGTVQPHSGLSNFEGTGTPVGDIAAGLAPGTADMVARITITEVPEPSAFVLFALLGTLSLAGRKRIY